MAVKSAAKTFAAKTHQTNNSNKVAPAKKESVTANAAAVAKKMPIEKPPEPSPAYDMPRDIVEEMPRLPSSTTSIMSLTKDAPTGRSTPSLGRPVHRSEYLKVSFERYLIV